MNVNALVADQTHDGRPIRMLTIVDEFTRECLAIRVERKPRSKHVLEVLGQLFGSHGIRGLFSNPVDSMGAGGRRRAAYQE